MHIQTLEKECYTSGEFVDEYRLLITLKPLKDDSPRVLLVDTEKEVGRGTFAQTSFRLPPPFRGPKPPFLLLERCAHKPSPTEYLAPFYQDPAQRIAVLENVGDCSPYLAFPVEASLKLARDHEGCEIEWGGWKEHVVFFPIYPRGTTANAWVSGCRLFRFGNQPDAQLEVYDFSTRGRVRLQTKRGNPDLGTVRYLESTELNPHPPWDPANWFTMYGGRESIVFFQVSVPRLSPITRLNDVLHAAA